MSGPAPAANRRRRNAPARGDWTPAPGEGWLHGDLPDPPEGLRPAALQAWGAWMRSWVASHWRPEDLPGLYITIRLYDQCDLAFEDPTFCYDGKAGTVCINRPNPVDKLKQYLDVYGITPKGQQDRRWSAPEQPKVAQPTRASATGNTPSGPTSVGAYAGLKAVD